MALDARQQDAHSARSAFAVTPNDTVDLEHSSRWIWIGAAGKLTYIPLNQDVSVTLEGIPVGTMLPISATRILAAGTDAGKIVALY